MDTSHWSSTCLKPQFIIYSLNILSCLIFNWMHSISTCFPSPFHCLAIRMLVVLWVSLVQFEASSIKIFLMTGASDMHAPRSIHSFLFYKHFCCKGIYVRLKIIIRVNQSIHNYEMVERTEKMVINKSNLTAHI